MSQVSLSKTFHFRNFCQPVGPSISVAESIMDTDGIWTDKYKNTAHIIFESIDPGVVVAPSLGLISIEFPEHASTAIKPAYHVSFFMSWPRFSIRSSDVGL